MNLFNIPGLDGYKTLIGSWTQIIAGLLLALAQLLGLISDCVSGVAALDACIQNLPLAFGGVIVAANGLMGLGIGHKAQAIIEATPGA